MGESRTENSERDDEDNSSSQYIIRKDVEPVPITDEMLQRQIRAQGPSGEAARLCRNVAIDYSVVTALHLDLLNIRKIDHLWMFVNLERLSLKCNKIERIENVDNLRKLRVLNLSFNCIERIENLEQLVRLEDLTLFRNKVRKIEHLDHLKRLIRLSVGNNLLDSVDGVNMFFFRFGVFA